MIDFVRWHEEFAEAASLLVQEMTLPCSTWMSRCRNRRCIAHRVPPPRSSGIACRKCESGLRYRHELPRSASPRLLSSPESLRIVSKRSSALSVLVLALFVPQVQCQTAPSAAQISNAPTLRPSLRPTRTSVSTPAPAPAPPTTMTPSNTPLTSSPSLRPSDTPSGMPTPDPPNRQTQRFLQFFEVPQDEFFSTEQQFDIGNLFASYTPRFAPESVDEVNSACLVRRQSVSTEPNSTFFVNQMEYTCSYLSATVNVSSYPELFLSYMDGNLTGVTSDLQGVNVSVLAALEASFLSVQTTAPTASERPSISPSLAPTFTAIPTGGPTIFVNRFPTSDPTTDFFGPSPAPTQQRKGGPGISVPAITSIVVLAGVAILIGLVVYYRQRSKKRAEVMRRPGERSTAPVQSVFAGGGKPRSDTEVGIPELVASGSIESNASMISKGESGLGADSGDEMDGTKHLQDEFDQYKDQNLEQLRSDVEGNLTGFEGVMSAAVTKALIGDDDAKMDPGELLWGCNGRPTGAEVEASALCEVSDWLKRNENASLERKRAFMQDMLNKMVASVRFGVLDAEDASRTIHESAALLGLQLANELPMTTVIISGMRKTVEASQIVKVLEEFGDIDTAAVASGERGFGIIRFRHPKSVERAMRRYRNAEIVVEDVAVQLKAIMPSGEVLSRA